MFDFTPLQQMRAIVLVFAVFMLMAMCFGQDYRNRPWREPSIRQSAWDTLRYTVEGRLVGEVPEFLFTGESCRSTSQGLVIVLVDEDGRLVKELPSFNQDLTSRLHTVKKQFSIDEAKLKVLFEEAGIGTAGFEAYNLELKGLLSDPGSCTFFPDALGRWLKLRKSRFDYHVKLSGAINKVGSLQQLAEGECDFEAIGMKIPYPPGVTGKLGIQFSTKDNFTQLTLDWKGKQDSMRIAPVRELQRRSERLRQASEFSADSLCKGFPGCGFKDTGEMRAALDKAIAARIDWNKDVTKELALWQISWLWYTGGNPQYDPFHNDPPLVPSIGDTLMVHYRLKALEAQMKAATEAKEPAVMSTAQLQAWAVEHAQLKHRQIEGQELYAALKEYDKQHAKGTLSQPDAVLNRTWLYLADREDREFNRNHDAANLFVRMKGTERKEYYETEHPHILLHNLAANEEPPQVFVLKTELKKHQSAISAAISEGVSLVSGAMGSIDLKSAPLVSYLFMGDTSAIDVPDDSKDPCKEWRCKLEQLVRLERQGELLAQRLRHLEAVMEEKPVKSKPVYRTEERSFEGSTRTDRPIAYSFGPSVSGKDTVRHGLYEYHEHMRFQVYTGFAYSILPTVSRVEATATSGTLVVEEKAEPLQWVVGVKIYPWGGEIDDNRISFHERRLSLSLGFSLPTPQDNFYIAPGIDILPGLTLATGLQLYRNTNYELLNGTIESESTRYDPAWFAALTIDGTAFAGLIKLIGL